MMFGFVTKAKHEAEVAALRAEINHLRPLAQKHLNSLAALKQNKGRKA
jgi:hypothetical protein